MSFATVSAKRVMVIFIKFSGSPGNFTGLGDITKSF